MGLVYKRSTDTSAIEAYNDSAGVRTSSAAIVPNSFSLQYPLNLDTSDEYGFNKVVFFINTRGNSKLVGDAGKNTTNIDYRSTVQDLPASQYNTLSSNKLAESLSGSSSTGLGGTIARLIAPKNMRLNAAIALYVPNNLNTSYGVNWSEEDMGNSALAQLGDLISGFGQKPVNNAPGSSAKSSSGINNAVNLGGSLIVKKIISGSEYAQSVAKMTAGNAKAEQLFRGVNFREFSFEYDFAPKSAEEAAAVLNIIRMFRYHMLPEYADLSSYMFIYPSEFEIKYFYKDKENTNLEKQMTAVLTNCTVNYTPNGQFNTFGDNLTSGLGSADKDPSGGMPTHIHMSLQFKELGLVTKETSPYDRSGL